ncbi:hypothetical protein SERLA73DRAFT_191623 [Serpula lacrymans var. lacrymans S7.3]|uniref:Uncharacterized protein n=2 Tax=Serpula lacrymans var. lacrymans TaxID=341189 RepID=F8QHY5_SERL3|nr:uncharacterized protein SERLADRAFT_477001 [Serpula lacrymans var. lacrymans S7.9]EGN92094.1 hypothetical protein SERLA73DRAFT_191623 [Serpula lacrymans var. lacrymans S7.3]EGO20614.1 hypothetical protein SERLADRAFT_477001 [Serpula lacrymans var. lacrymans S7.9]
MLLKTREGKSLLAVEPEIKSIAISTSNTFMITIQHATNKPRNQEEVVTETKSPLHHLHKENDHRGSFVKHGMADDELTNLSSENDEPLRKVPKITFLPITSPSQVDHFPPKQNILGNQNYDEACMDSDSSYVQSEDECSNYEDLGFENSKGERGETLNGRRPIGKRVQEEINYLRSLVVSRPGYEVFCKGKFRRGSSNAAIVAAWKFGVEFEEEYSHTMVPPSIADLGLFGDTFKKRAILCTLEVGYLWMAEAHMGIRVLKRVGLGGTRPNQSVIALVNSTITRKKPKPSLVTYLKQFDE